MVTAPATESIEKAAATAWDGPPTHVFVGVPVTDELLERLSDEYDGLWFEAGGEGEIVITGFAGGPARLIGAIILEQIRIWLRSGAGGAACDSQSGYHPPAGRPLGPDVSWLSEATFASLTEAQMLRRFWPVAPDFVVEIVSPSQSLRDQQAKMRDWISAEVRLGLLLSPGDELVEFYWSDGRVESFHRPDAVSCDPVMPGFTLQLDEVWRQ